MGVKFLQNGNAGWPDYEASVSHFATGTNGTCVDGATKSQYAGLHKKWCSSEIVMGLKIMFDSLNELSTLWLSCKTRYNTTICRRSNRRIDKLKEHPGPMVSLAQTAADELKFKSTQLQRNVKHVAINQCQFITSLHNNLQQQLFTTTTADAGDGTSN